MFFSVLETEIWNFDTEDHKVVNPAIQQGTVGYGIGLFIVPFDFCAT